MMITPILADLGSNAFHTQLYFRLNSLKGLIYWITYHGTTVGGTRKARILDYSSGER